MKIAAAFKHMFIPHEHNDYKPHFFREVSVAVIVLVSLFMLGFSAGSSFLIRKTVLGANLTANILVDLTNESRTAFNEPPLVRSNILDQAANLKAKDMVTEGYFAHTSPKGVTPWHWFKEVGYTFLYAGENLAINFLDAQEVRDAWLASPTHRANLLDIKFKEIGMATISGVYKNDPTIYVVQLFGTPAKESTENKADVEAIKSATSNPEEMEVSANTFIAQKNPEIKGEAASNTPMIVATIPKPPYEPLITSLDFAVVKNTENVEPIVERQAQPATYSTWYERLVFGSPYYVSITLKTLIALVFVALLTMILVEIRKQHWKHIAYGLSLLVILTSCIIINQAFF